MTFSFIPLDETTAMNNKISLVEEGYYEAEIVTVEEKKSPAGNHYLNLKLRIWDKNGKERYVFTTLVSHPSFIYKIRHLCYLVGLQNEYESGQFDPRLLEGRPINGVAHVVIKKGEAKKYPEVGFYKDKNEVEDFLPKDKARTDRETGVPIAAVVGDEMDDEIPF